MDKREDISQQLAQAYETKTRSSKLKYLCSSLHDSAIAAMCNLHSAEIHEMQENSPGSIPKVHLIEQARTP
eukprot:4077834-Amphidinium_carterae.1